MWAVLFLPQPTRPNAVRLRVWPALEETEARRRWRGVAEALEARSRIDHDPGAAAEQAHAEFDALRQALDARFSRGEPAAKAPQRIDVGPRVSFDALYSAPGAPR